MLNPAEVESLLSRLCVKLGLCLAPDDRLELEESPPAEAGAFTDAVFRFEGLDPASADRQRYGQALALVEEAFRSAAGATG